MILLYRILLRICRPRADASQRRDMLSVFEAVVHGAPQGRRLSRVRIAGAEFADLLLSPLKADPLPPAGSIARSVFSIGAGMLPSWHDWRAATRRVGARPGHSATVVAILALGIAVNTTVFSVADAALFRGLPYPNGSRTFELFRTDATGKNAFPGLSADDIIAWRTHGDLFDAVEAFSQGTFLAAGGAEPEQVFGAFVTPGLFPALGVQPARGRLFVADDAAPDEAQVALISDALWRSRFGSDPHVVGRTLTLDDRRYTVVGVMRPHFRFPAGHQNVWLPVPIGGRGDRLEGYGILKPGVSRKAAQDRVDVVAAGLQRVQPRAEGWGLRLMPPRGARQNVWTQQALRVLTVAVLVVMLIACVNLANLSLAQALSRTRELSVRAALGASRWRLVRELLAEHLLLGLAGGALGLALSWWGVAFAVSLAPATLTLWSANEIRIDTRIVLFTAAVTIGSAILFGLLPAWKASRASAGGALKGRTSDAAVGHGRLRGALVIAEVALSCVLLVGAALLIRSFARLAAVDPGFSPRNLLVMSLAVPVDRYPAAARRSFLEQLEAAISAVPGVEAVTLANGVPTSGSNLHFGQLETEEGHKETSETVIPNTLIAPDYFATLGIPLLAGRTFTSDELPTAAVISEGFARRLWPDGSALGKRFRMSSRWDWLTVVGIAGEVRSSRSIERDSVIEMYSPLFRPPAKTAAAPPPRPRGGARPLSYVRVIVRGPRPAEFAPAVKQAIWRIDAAQPIDDVLLVEDVLAKSLSEDRFAAILMGTFAALALLLAAAGLYAVLAQLVAQRRQEIGIRMALGAARSDVARVILGRGVGLTMAGIGLGLTGAWAAARFLANQLYHVAPHDPVSFTVVPLVLFAIALLASWLPARRALSVDPASALRME